MRYNVVIVGAGPAGLMAARTINNKLSYLLIDSKKEIGEPLRCAEGLREETFRKFFRHTNYDFVKNRVNEHKMVCEDLTRIINAPCLELDRVEFEKWLAEPLKNIQLETRCEDVAVKKDHVVVKTNKGDIKADLVILCHGTDYHIQKKFGMLKEDVVIAVGIGGLYRNHGLDKDYFYLYFDNDYLGGFWVFPKSREEANIGYVAYEKGSNLKKSFNDLMKKYGFDKAELIKPYAGTLPISGPIYKTYSNRILVCGNAAGHVYAGTGEGVPFALEGGKIAGEIALKAKKNNFSKRFLSLYEAEWKKAFGNIMEAGVNFSYFIAAGYKYSAYKKIFSAPTDSEIKAFVFDGETPKRAKIAIRFMKLFFKTKIKYRDTRKEPVPKELIRIYNIYKKLAK